MSVLGVMPVYVKNDRDTALTLKAAQTFFETAPAELLYDPFLLAIDDGSPYQEGVDQIYRAKIAVSRKENSGFANTVNGGLGLALATGHDALLVNADLEFSDNRWLQAMLDTDADIVGAKLLYPSGLVQHAGIFYSFYTRLFSHIGRFAPSETPELNVERECPVTGALMLIRHHVLEEIGLFDESFSFGFEDVSYCLDAIQAGFKVKYQPKAVALHHESAFRGPKPEPHVKEWMDQSWNRLQEKHAGLDITSIVPTLLS